MPFQYSRLVREHLRHRRRSCSRPPASPSPTSTATRFYDLTGSYGVNLFGYDFYKECIAEGAERAHALGPVLGAYHPSVADNVQRLCGDLRPRTKCRSTCPAPRR